MKDKPTKEDLEFVNKMGVGEYKIKYNKDATADLVHKRAEDDHMGIPLEWSDRDCLKTVSEDIENAIKSIKENINDNFAEGMSTLESVPDIIKLHMSKDDLFIIRDPAKKEHEEYLKRRKNA
tara:strand:- start:281 stop:646 length:366 start_codon:yes stop_codon:yes gene_type:complete